MLTEKKDIAIAGAGLVGTLLGIYLKKKNYNVTVFDRSEDIRKIKFSGRSINLAMSTRGWNALDKVGIGDEIRKIAIAMDKRAIHLKDGSLSFQPYGINGEAIYSISRGGLNRMMIDLAEKAGVHFEFNQKIWDVNLETATLYIGENEHGPFEEQQFDQVYGADGAFSRIRHRMQRQNRFNYSQYFLNIGYKELTIPANADGSHKIDPNSFHIWPRGEFMLIALSNDDGSFTCTLFMPFEGVNSFEEINTEDKLTAFFNEYFSDTKDLIIDLKKDYFTNPTSSLVTMHCYPWTYKDKVALIGDSAHAIVPFYGQGMNAGFEDITALSELLDEFPNDIQTVFEKYQEKRKPNADAIAELSYRNFIEMSTKTADADFLLQKKIEAWFTKLHPEKWLPLYDRVTFSLNPYEDALAIGDFQKNVMDQVMKLPNIHSDWQTKEVENFILGLLNTKKADN
ncbi:FAD-dependent monooxygenase [Flavobacterium sp. CBA20B-1]|uniref:FAD-dependent oxidoreductase n=1 Tax=unclassified Flavobacterium TaxID=196869 RepID=UPI002224D077|nr:MULTISPECIES: NAD(P)/FAD-dependent oxidoreductase [unclassified Flavobacterium]WCM41765.1 FAD-dependent monooxygenase [Flavobacterium sp. CBA20B-1]